MSNIFDYIKLNKDKTLKEKKITTIDKTILTLLSYIDFRNIVPTNDEKITLDNALYMFIKNKDKKEFLKLAPFNNKIYELAKSLINTKRYSNIKLSNYLYINNTKQQIGALTFHLPNLLFISFEGTETSLIGWKEDMQMSYEYPIPSGLTAINYVNDVIKPLDFNIIISGHSKGGHLALISSMNQKFINKKKIKEIISIDGPGLKEEEYHSELYIKIKNKYHHIIPNYSIVGELLYNDNDEVVKSNRIDLFAHSPFEWEINENEFVKTNINKLSVSFNKSFTNWLEHHPLEERKKIIQDVFAIFKKLNIDNINQFLIPKNIINILKETKNLDPYTKELLKSFIVRSDK